MTNPVPTAFSSQLYLFSLNNDTDLATKTSQPCSQSTLMIPSSTQPLSSLHQWEKNKSEDEKRVEPPELDNETVAEKRPLRSRGLRLSTLYQPAHHHIDLEHESPPPCPPTFSKLFHDSPKEQEDSLYTPLPSSSTLQKFHNFRQSLRLPQLLLDSVHSFFESPSFWLAMYFVLNLSLTLYNKSVLIHFPFPYTLTALHALCGTIGASILLRFQDSGTLLNTTTPKFSWSKITPDLTAGELVVLLLFSMLYTLNIVVSNASLRLVTVPFHQVVRSSTPFFTIVFSLILLNKRCSKLKVLTLIPVVIGVCFATYGDYYFTAIGLFLTLLGTILAALKTILTNIILVKQSAPPLPFSSESSNHLPSNEVPDQPSPSLPSFFSGLLSITTSHFFNSSPSTSATTNTTNTIKPPALSSFTLPKLSLNPLQLLYLLSPLAFIQTTLLAHFTGELSQVQLHLFYPSSSAHPEGATTNFRVWLVSNGILAFFLNVVSFNSNRRVGPLAMSVAANVKQVLTVLCAVFMFDLTITPANGLGIVLTILGGALYAAVELREKQSRRRWVR